MPQQNNNGPISYNMNPYTGAWTKVEAGHLLRRTMFGPTNQQILDAVTNGMAATVTSLLQIPPISEPVAYHPDETIAAFNTSWVNSVYPSNPTAAGTVANARNLSLAAWILKRMNEENVGISISEKMCLFWQNHFASTATGDPRATYDYFVLIHQYALGNFRQFVKDMTINPAMLLFLNGATNNVFSPNENYARELLELFTVGKGPQVGPGDYTNYTEADVAAGAKILTGYYVDGIGSDTLTDVTSSFVPILHDTTNKTLSAYFGNAVIVDNGPNEYADYIDVIFNQSAVAEHISRKLYRYFVNFDLTADVETNVIPIMAANLIANNYEILPVMSLLLSSEHFYDASVRGALIKSPLEMMFSMFNSTESTPSFDLVTDSEMYVVVYSFAEAMGQGYASPPSVSGWPAYYQAPSYSQLWVNSALLKTRFQVTDYITVFTGIPGNGNNWKLNVLDFLDNLSLPSSAPDVIDDIADVFTPKGLSPTKILILKAVLTNGLPDFEWTLQYNEYLANPGNSTFSDPVKERIELVLQQLFHMPEFQTI